MKIIVSADEVRAKIDFLRALDVAATAAERLRTIAPAPNGNYDPSDWMKGAYQARKYVVEQVLGSYGGVGPYAYTPDGPRAARAQRVMCKMFGPIDVYPGTRGRARGRALIPVRPLPLPG